MNLLEDYTQTVRDFLAKRKVDHQNIQVFGATGKVRYVIRTSELVCRYLDSYSDHSIEYYSDISEHAPRFAADAKLQGKILNMARQAMTTEENVRNLCSLDHFFGLTGKGKPLVPITADHVFVRALEEDGYSIEEFVAFVKNQLYWIGCSEPSDVRNVVITAFTNIPWTDRETMFTYFHQVYRNIHDRAVPCSRKLAFQGPVWGKETFTIDVRLSKGVHYRSSKQPTITMRSEMPETVRLSLPGTPINDLLETPMFSPGTKIVRTATARARTGNMVTMTLEPDRVDISHLGVNAVPLKKAA